MTEVQQSLLNLLKEIDLICRKYNIEYYLGGGTLIGAIRHGGFLPWDDDTDIHMSRDNAIRFKTALESEHLQNRMVYIGDKRGNYMYPQWRYYNTKTTLLLRGLVQSPAPQGQYVDIFVNYPLPKDEKKKKKCIEYYELYIELKANNTTFTSLRDKEYLKKFFRLQRIEKIVGHMRVLKWLENNMYSYPEDEAEEWMIDSATPPLRTTPKSWWGKPRDVPFEDTYLMVAEKAELLLKEVYGATWFEIPKRLERDSHIFVIDTNNPYNVYVSEYKKYVNLKSFYKFEVSKKKTWYKMVYLRNQVNPKIHLLQGQKIVLETKGIIEQRQIDLYQMVVEEHFVEIENIFKKYLDFISKSNIKYWGIYVDMPDEFLYAMLYQRCMNGKYGLARKILSQRRVLSERELTINLRCLCEICDATDELLTSLYAEFDLDKARSICDIWLKKYPKLLYFMRADIYLYLQQDNISTLEATMLFDKCTTYLDIYPEDGELLKYLGDLYEIDGKSENAMQCYKRALYSLDNGLCLKELKKKLSIA